MSSHLKTKVLNWLCEHQNKISEKEAEIQSEKNQHFDTDISFSDSPHTIFMSPISKIEQTKPCQKPQKHSISRSEKEHSPSEKSEITSKDRSLEEAMKEKEKVIFFLLSYISEFSLSPCLSPIIREIYIIAKATMRKLIFIILAVSNYIPMRRHSMLIEL
jgi:hypothetical protein